MEISLFIRRWRKSAQKIGDASCVSCLKVGVVAIAYHLHPFWWAVVMKALRENYLKNGHRKKYIWNWCFLRKRELADFLMSLSCDILCDQKFSLFILRRTYYIQKVIVDISVILRYRRCWLFVLKNTLHFGPRYNWQTSLEYIWNMPKAAFQSFQYIWFLHEMYVLDYYSLKKKKKQGKKKKRMDFWL